MGFRKKSGAIDGPERSHLTRTPSPEKGTSLHKSWSRSSILARRHRQLYAGTQN